MLTQRGCYLNRGVYAGREELDFGIKEGDKVLDIGGGSLPWTHATHILDSVEEDYVSQRHGRIARVFSHQTFINGTTDKLPEFDDNEFDFVYINHCAEHFDDLPRDLDEISRVSKRGFISVPQYLYDFYTATLDSGHVWFCEYKNDTFIITRRKESEYMPCMSSLWGHTLWSTDIGVPLRNIWEAHGVFGTRFLWDIRFYWEDNIDYILVERDSDEEKFWFPQLVLFADFLEENPNLFRKPNYPKAGVRTKWLQERMQQTKEIRKKK